MNSSETDASLSSTAHDFKSPLTGIQMMLHLLSEQKVGSLNEKQEMMVKQAIEDCHRLVGVIDDHFKKL